MNLHALKLGPKERAEAEESIVQRVTGGQALAAAYAVESPSVKASSPSGPAL